MTNDIDRDCIDACHACAVACDQCQAACLQEPDVGRMARCIASDIDCAQICRLAAGTMARGSALAAAVCRLCAQACRARGDTADAYRLRRASTHWLRHTHALQALARGVPLGTTQHRLGHAAPSTTALYAAALRP